MNMSDAQADQLVELNVQLSYKDWKRRVSDKKDLRDTIASKIVDFGKDWVQNKVRDKLFS